MHLCFGNSFFNYLFAYLQISLSTTTVDYGDTFINYKCVQTLLFQNDTDLAARYEVITQEQSADPLAVYQVDPPEGIVEAYSMFPAKIIFTAQKTGNINLPLYFRVKGSDQAPLEVSLVAKSSG
jgi:hypothetical protein